MKPERLPRQFFALEATLFALILFLPLGGSAAPSTQESGAKETKKSEPAAKPSDAEASKPPSELSNVETSEERREGLDRKLDSSLSEFDSLILREQEILEQRRESSAAAGGGGGAGTAEAGGGSRGGAEGGDESEPSGAAEGTGGSSDEPSGEEVATKEGAPTEGSEAETGEVSNGRIPPDVGDGSDDDIVARQIREAAMKEDDPELREKLWDEYRAYKFGEKKKETEG
jgi:hypothetical protein